MLCTRFWHWLYHLLPPGMQYTVPSRCSFCGWTLVGRPSPFERGRPLTGDASVVDGQTATAGLVSDAEQQKLQPSAVNAVLASRTLLRFMPRNASRYLIVG
jgi:hypothetical protein